MKKIFSLLAALIVLSTSGVWAQDASTTATKVAKVYEDETTATDLTSGYYVMQVSVNSKVGFAYYNGTNPITNSEGQRFVVNTESGQSTQTVAAKDDLAYVWYISKSADNSMLSIQSARTGAFIPVQEVRDDTYKNMKLPKGLANAAALYYSDGTINGKKEGVMLYQTNYKHDAKNLVVHVNGYGDTWYMSYWEGGNPTGKTSVCVFKFYKVDLVEGVSTSATLDARPIRFQPQIDGDNVEEDVCAKVLKNGDEITYPLGYSDMLYNAPSLSETTVSASTGTVTANFTSKESPSITLDTYYKLKIPRSTTLHVTQDGNVQQTYSSKNFIVGYYNPKTFWKFVKDGLKVKMVCGTGKYVNVGMPASDNNTQKATFVDDATNAVRFSLCDKPSNSGYTGNGGFLLKMESSDKVVLGDHSGSSLGSWKHTDAFTDGGSCFIKEAQLTPEEIYLLIPDRLKIDQPSSLNENLLRVATPARIDQAKGLLPNHDSQAPLQQMINAYNMAFEVRPDANAFYRIKNMNILTGNHTEAEAKRYPSSEDIAVATNGSLQTAYDNNKGNINRTITRKSVGGNIVAQLWQFVDAGDGSYYIQNANTGCRWANTYSGNMDMPTENNSNVAGKFSIVAAPVTGKGNDGAIATQNDGVSTFLITLQGQHAINAHGGLFNSDILKEDGTNATPCSDAGNYWQIEKIDNFDVAISDARYATVGYPFPVQVTNTDVKVYYATAAENGILKLTEAKNKIIPANEGAILYCESGATIANMNILPSTDVTFANNKLTATTAKREGFASLSTYGLSNKNGVVCFRKNSDTNVPANKAYLDANKYTSNSGSAQQLLFSFDNVVEGIDNVVKAQNANKVYYDLQGRRVLYPANGIFVTENGEKVFIK